MRCSKFVLSCLLALSAVTPAAQAQMRYNATDLTTLGGAFVVNGVTTNGSFVGDANNHAFIYDKTGFHDLGALVPGGGSQGLAANSKGQVAGFSEVTYPQQTSPHAFLYDSAGMHDLGTLAGGSYSWGRAINENGVIAGFSTNTQQNAPGDFHAVYWDSKGIHDLGNFGSYADAFAINNSNQILVAAANGSYLHDGTGDHFLQTAEGDTIHPYFLNDSGQVSGYFYDTNSIQHAILYDSTGGTELGTLPGGTYSAGYNLSSNGLMTGDADIANGDNHAFLYDSGGMHDLGSFGNYSSSYGVNSSGQVVGLSDDGTGTGNNLAFLYEQGSLYDLNTLSNNLNGFTLNSAGSINDLGDMVAYGTDASGHQHVFALTPVPEPSSIALLIAGGLTGAAFLRRRKTRMISGASASKRK